MSANIKVRFSSRSNPVQTPISLNSLAPTIRGISDIGDVDTSGVANNATLVYNSTTQTYEVRLMEYTDLSGVVDLDFGTF